MPTLTNHPAGQRQKRSELKRGVSSGLLLLLITTVALAGSADTQSAAADQKLRQIFQSPPDDARPMVRWWWFGPAVTQPELKREIEVMKAGGFGGFEVQPTYPLAVDDQAAGLVNLKFLSPEFLNDLNYVASVAKTDGIRMDLTMGSGWPYGGPQFPIAQAAGRLRTIRVQPQAGQAEAKCPPLRDGETIISAFQGAIALKVTGGTAQLPASAAAPLPVVFFLAGHTGMKVKRPALGAEGFVIDHDNPSVVSKFIEQIANREIEACGANVPHAIFCDSLEVEGEDWTDNFLAEFQKRRGYDLAPLLPKLLEQDAEAAEIRHDWGQTLTELFNDSFMKSMRRCAADHKTRFRIQAYGSPSAGLFSYADADLPEGEGYQWHNYRATRYASSACHLMGIPVSSSETFTWLHRLVFRATPLDIKAEADLHFLQGVNQIICHGWPYTAAGVADPGWSFYAAAVFDEKNPWYIAIPDVNRYLTRVSSMMRQGRPANDVALYLANDDAWANFTPGHISLTDGVGKQLGDQIVGQILDAGYNLDFFDDQMLERFGKIDGGKLAFGDVRYPVVILASVQRIPVATLRKLEAMARAGGIVIATRRKPDQAPGHLATQADTDEIRAISHRLFDGPEAPGIFLENETALAKALFPRLAPDVATDPPAPQIGIVHRHTDDAEIYFLANTANTPMTTRATFRVEGLRPELWNPLTGTAEPVDAVGHAAGATTLPIALDAYESVIVVWAAHGASAPATARSSASAAPIPPIDLSRHWTVQFGPDAKPQEMAALRSWTDDPATRGFSGVCTYTNHVTIAAGIFDKHPHFMLDFGPSSPAPGDPATRRTPGFIAELDAPVRDAAVVFINGHRAGSVWCPPYRLDITPWLTPGTNELRLDVANTVVNAVAAKGFPNYDVSAITRQFGNRFPVPPANAFQALSSGLMGPIELRVSR